MLTDGSKVTVPVAEVYIDSPYLKGRYEAQCMGNPVYDLIVGNVPGTKSPDEMDQKWQANAVETRQQKINKGKPYSALKVPKTIADTVDPHAVKMAQEEDPTLSIVRQYVLQNAVHVKMKGKVTCHKKRDLLFR